MLRGFIGINHIHQN